MARPISPPPHFDDQSPWGTYRPGFLTGMALALAHIVPGALKPLAVVLRRNVKYHRAQPLDLEIRGLKLRLLPRGNISEEKYYTSPRLFDPAEFSVLEGALKPGGVFIDIGANAGIYSLHAHNCMKGRGRILAVEPDSEMARRLAFNLRTNNLRDIEIIPLALSDREGFADFFVNPNQRGTNTLETNSKAGPVRQTQTVRVQVGTLLALLQSKKIEKIDALKIDVEGYEHAVFGHFFANAPASLFPRVIICEFSPDSASGTAKLLEAAGYRCSRKTNLNLIYERD